MSQNAVRTELALSLYGDLLSYFPYIKFLSITFDNRMSFKKHFEKILECCNHKFHRQSILVNKKWGPTPTTILQIYKQSVRPIFEYGIVSTIAVAESVINKIQRVHKSHLARMHANPSLSIQSGIQSTQLGTTQHGTNTRHQFTY